MSSDILKKAVVIGGSNGIGLAIVIKLVSEGYFVEILDREEPEEGIIPAGSYEYHFCDLLYLNEEYISSIASDKSVEVLMITAGFGRICEFEYMHTAEIKNMMTVNATSTIEILRLFYDRIKSDDKFYCGVMGSIAGLLSSPEASVYSASKAAVCRFIESVNIELEASGTSNRILNVSPSTFKGSKFYGGDNRLELLEPLASKIVSKLFSSTELYIPQYKETFKEVIESYQADPHEYGFHSYQYKKDSGRVDNHKRVKIGYLSGTFDLFHVGHINILRRAKAECDYLIVGVHESGAWKGKETFIPFEERCETIASCRYVDKVVKSCTEDSDAWAIYHFNKLFVGSDYKGSERFKRYEEFFKDKNVEIVYFPYTETTNSTQIRKTVRLRTKDIK